MHSLARKFPRYATTSKTRQGASLELWRDYPESV